MSDNVIKATGNDTPQENESDQLQYPQGLEVDFLDSTDSFSEKPLKPYTAPDNTLIYKEKNCSEKQFIKIGWGGWKRFCQPLKPLYFQKYFLMGGGMATLCVTLLCHTHLQLKDSIQNCT